MDRWRVEEMDYIAPRLMVGEIEGEGGKGEDYPGMRLQKAESAKLRVFIGKEPYIDKVRSPSFPYLFCLITVFQKRVCL